MKRILIAAVVICLFLAGLFSAISYFSPHPILPDPDDATLVSFIYRGHEMVDKLNEIDTNYLLQLLARYECKRTLRRDGAGPLDEVEFVLGVRNGKGIPISVRVGCTGICCTGFEQSICEIVYGEYLHEKLATLVAQQAS